MLSIIVRIPILNSQCIYFVHSKMIRNAHRLLNSMAVGLGRGAPSIELARLIGIPSPSPSPHSSVVGRGNRPTAWCWCQKLRPRGRRTPVPPENDAIPGYADFEFGAPGPDNFGLWTPDFRFYKRCMTRPPPESTPARPLDVPLRTRRGVGPERASQLARLRIHTIDDLLL